MFAEVYPWLQLGSFLDVLLALVVYDFGKFCISVLARIGTKSQEAPTSDAHQRSGAALGGALTLVPPVGNTGGTSIRGGTDAH
jgi:hypothetical protein